MAPTKANIYKGRNERVGPGLEIVRTLPNASINALGSVVFIDHLVENIIKPKKAEMPDGGFAHPHRGIATFTYILDGGVHHLDSNGGEGKVYKGGIQWMNAGNGIIHDEFTPFDIQENGGKIHGLQIWVNLPKANKKENPDYIAVQGKDVPEISLANNSGKMRVLLGEYGGKASTIPTYLDQLIGHIYLEPGKSADLNANTNWQYGIYAIKGTVKVDNQIELKQYELAELTDFQNQIKLTNEGKESIDIAVIAGEAYRETMVAYGPFVMNTEEEIELAYSDSRKGKYGGIDYSRVQI
jgi:hypothetical protein